MKPKVDPKFRGAKGGNGGKKIKGVHFSLVTHTPMIQRTTLTDTLKGTEPQSTKQR